MESYAAVLNYAIPVFAILMGIELVASRVQGRTVYRTFDAVSSISSGLTNIIKDVLGLTVIIVGYGVMVEHVALVRIEVTWVLVVLAFVGKDFAGYWSHRWAHEINIFWNRHIIHHSSEEFNLACALRQSVSEIFGIFFFLYLPLALLGVPAWVIGIVAPLHLFMQFWYHTRLIGKMGWLEYVIVTPSHHRVHHAINPEYIDKNFGQIFILWDKWFGTFQPELPDVPPVYGIKKQANTWNPILINYQHVWQLAKDAWHTRSWWDKIRLWFMPTGWRPEDVRESHPVKVVTDPYAQVKYDTPASGWLKAWSVAQLAIHLALMLYLFNRIADFAFVDLLLYGGFVVLGIFSYTTLMDRSRWSILTEVVKVGLGVFLIWRLGDWYGLDGYVPGGTGIVSGYLVVSLVAAVGFSLLEGGPMREAVSSEG